MRCIMVFEKYLLIYRNNRAVYTHATNNVSPRVLYHSVIDNLQFKSTDKAVKAY